LSYGRSHIKRWEV